VAVLKPAELKMRHTTKFDLAKLAERLGPLHARQRLGIELDHEAQIIGQGINFFGCSMGNLAGALRTAFSKITGIQAGSKLRFRTPNLDPCGEPALRHDFAARPD
jgi:hypothetical protein